VSGDVPRWLAVAHGLTAWIGVVVLARAVWVRVRPRATPPGRAAPTLAAVALSLAAATGFLLEPTYLYGLRQRLFVRSASLGWLLERKQHLSAGALFFAIAAALLVHVERGSPARLDAVGERRLLVAAAMLALAAAVAGTIVGLRGPR
jgi:hypothetical protein